ncbi:MAG: PilN domain-containing protein [Pseudomonadota bacterium]
MLAWSLLTPVLRNGLRWWLGELNALLPQPLRAALSKHKRRLELAAERVLVRRTSLPLAAEENLREVIAFEMDRVLPFQAEEVYFDYIVIQRDAEHGRVLVEIAAARRDVVDALVKEAGNITGVGVSGLDPRFDLRPPQVGRRTLRPVDWAMLGVGVLLLLVAVGAPFHRLNATIDALEAELASLRTDAQEAQRLRASIDTSLAAERLIVERRLARPMALTALEEVTRLTADDSWLQQFRMTAEGVELQGVAGASSQLLRAVEDSPVFEGGMFRAPVAQDPKTNRERFSLGAKWQHSSN